MGRTRDKKQDPELFSALLESVYDAALDPAHWRWFLRFLQGLCGVLNAKSGMFRVIDERITAIRANIHYNLDPDLQEAHRQYYVNRDVFIDALRDKPGNFIAPGEAFLSLRELQRTEFFADYMQPQDSFHVCGGLAMRNAEFTIKFGLQRERNTGAFSTRDADYIRRAARMGHLLDLAEQQTASAEQALESLAVGILLLDERQHIIHANFRAERMLNHSRGLSRTRGQLNATHEADIPTLRRMLDTILVRAKLNGPPVPEAMLLTPLPGDPRLLVVACPVPASKPHFQGPWPRVASAVFISNLQDAGLLNHDVLMTLYGLTASEARLACALARGRELSEISAEWSVSRETLRTHLKRVLSKTGTGRQSELVRLLNGKPWNMLGDM